MIKWFKDTLHELRRMNCLLVAIRDGINESNARAKALEAKLIKNDYIKTSGGHHGRG